MMSANQAVALSCVGLVACVLSVVSLIHSTSNPDHVSLAAITGISARPFVSTARGAQKSAIPGRHTVPVASAQRGYNSFATATDKPRTHLTSNGPEAPAMLGSMAETTQQRGAPVKALEIDWSDPDTLIGLVGAILGVAVGLGAPIFYSMQSDRDEERLEELRQLNRQTKDQTGEYLTEEEIRAIRTPKWTDRREFVDDD